MTDIQINRRPLPAEVEETRRHHDQIDKDNQQVLAPRIDLHLEVQEALIAQMSDHVDKLVEETDFDPAAENRAVAAWLLAARAMALAQALTTLLRAGFCTEAEPDRPSTERGAALDLADSRPERGEGVGQVVLRGRLVTPERHHAR